VPEEEEAFPLGQARIVRPGREMTLIAYGAMVQEAVLAAERAETELHCSIEVIDLLTIAPMDTATLVESVEKTQRCVIVHEAPATCGVGAEIIARLNEHCLTSLAAPIARVTGYDIPYPFFAREREYLPSVSRILAAIRKTIEF
jgi:pyruvate/2-oxoglutarate/acetoin dehydrogenase E1 component